MIKSATLAGLATLALATVPMLALATAAQAAPVTVQVADIDAATPQGAQTLETRVEHAAAKFCSHATRLSERQACKDGVKLEVAEKVDARNAMLAARGSTLASR
ncbi:MAG: UrcA family protein [Phenylobacterium sp.]|uniref:UrcA family protein n=1 Tax=Phenylobacterium sp. TaxID=1871053 RepID=UPI003918F1F8